MAFDIAAHLGAITREVRDLEIEGQLAKVIVASRIYDTTPADLWGALTQPERLKRWFAPVTGDLKLGGRYHVEGNASGTITACVPQDRAELTWEFGGYTSWVNFSIVPAEGGTMLVLEHIAHVSPHWTQYGAGAGGVGWEMGLLGLSEHLRRPADDVRSIATGRRHPRIAEVWLGDVRVLSLSLMTAADDELPAVNEPADEEAVDASEE